MANQTSRSKDVLRVAVDIGGTFTDGVANLARTGQIWVGKTLTTPDDPGEAVTTVVTDLLDQVKRSLGADAPLLGEVVHGTTLITNTLIERKGVKTALVTTRGMRDVLNIGREWRYEMFNLDMARPRPLVEANCAFEVEERLSARGEVMSPLSDASLDRMVDQLKAADMDSVAVSLLHSYLDATHEKRIEERIRQSLPRLAVSISSDLAREINEFERTSTTAANAYVKPIVAAYLQELQSRVDRIRPDTPLRVMVSSGGFTSARAGARSPILLLESGPAAGVLSALNTARQNGVGRVLAFDMGGTTAKACVSVAAEPPIAHSFECARVERFKKGSGLPILIPSIDLIEIGAGGGSIAHRNRLGLLNIGPESAGSIPGPACYGQGGAEATVTDADLLLGYLNPANFLGGEMQLNPALAMGAAETLAAELGVNGIEMAWGICNMVNENMANAARVHIAENGHDPRDFTLVATGGAGPVHAVEVARKLRMPRVLVPIAAGAGSCLGMLAAPARVDRSWSHPQLLAEIDWTGVASTLHYLKREGETELASAGAGQVEWTIGAEVRYYGQGAQVIIALPYETPPADMQEAVRTAFEQEYQRLYGRLVPGARHQVTTWRLTGREQSQAHRFAWGDDRSGRDAAPPVLRSVYLPLKKAFEKIPVHDRYSVRPGQVLQGPLILEERESTIVVAVKAEVTVLADLTVSIEIREFE